MNFKNLSEKFIIDTLGVKEEQMIKFIEEDYNNTPFGDKNFVNISFMQHFAFTIPHIEIVDVILTDDKVLFNAVINGEDERYIANNPKRFVSLNQSSVYTC